jgi:tetratricopeptide (TPR) repeat protein
MVKKWLRMMKLKPNAAWNRQLLLHTMRLTPILLGLTLVCLSSGSVGQSLEDRITDKLCECFKTVDKSAGGGDILDKYQANCLMQTLRQFESEINEISDTVQGDTDYERGRKFGKYISTRTQVIMIYRCDEFFRFMDEFRKGVFNGVDNDKELLNIKTKTKEIQDRQQPSDYYLRALSYLVLKEFKMARKDLDKAIKLDKNYASAYLLRGFLFELNSKFSNAIADYEQSNKLMTRGDIEIYIAMAKRKERDR